MCALIFVKKEYMTECVCECTHIRYSPLIRFTSSFTKHLGYYGCTESCGTQLEEVLITLKHMRSFLTDLDIIKASIIKKMIYDPGITKTSKFHKVLF